MSQAYEEHQYTEPTSHTADIPHAIPRQQTGEDPFHDLHDPNAYDADLVNAVHRAALVYCDRRQDAEDAAQNAFLSALQTPNASVRYPRAYLATAARRSAMDQQRRRSREKLVDEFDDSMLQFSERNGIDIASRVTEELTTHPTLRAFIEGLDDRQKEIIDLMAVGYSVGEVRKRLGVKANVVSSCLYRMREHLRQTQNDIDAADD
jgi:RNA polymerase sigma factor (sigma-70 family)